MAHDHGDADDGGAIVAAAIPAGSITNARLATSAGEIGAAWAAWTPTLSGRFNDGKWTKACKYIQIGKTIIAKISLTASSATPMDGGSSDALLTLPVTAATLANTGNVGVVGQFISYDTSSPTLYQGYYIFGVKDLRCVRHVHYPTISNLNSSDDLGEW
jgi:hypothetical protein